MAVSSSGATREAQMDFRVCGGCGRRWPTRDDLLGDPQVGVCGYQVRFGDLGAGLFLFNHLDGKCYTTFSIAAEAFTDLHKGPMFNDNLFGTDDCMRLCTDLDRLDPCPRRCECAYVRSVLDKVNTWPKRSLASGG